MNKKININEDMHILIDKYTVHILYCEEYHVYHRQQSIWYAMDSIGMFIYVWNRQGSVGKPAIPGGPVTTTEPAQSHHHPKNSSPQVALILMIGSCLT